MEAEEEEDGLAVEEGYAEYVGDAVREEEPAAVTVASDVIVAEADPEAEPDAEEDAVAVAVGI